MPIFSVQTNYGPREVNAPTAQQAQSIVAAGGAQVQGVLGTSTPSTSPFARALNFNPSVPTPSQVSVTRLGELPVVQGVQEAARRARQPSTPTTAPLSEFPEGMVPAFPGETGSTWNQTWGYVKPESAGPPAGTFGPLFGGTEEPLGYVKPVTGDPVYDELLKTLRDYLDELRKRGEVINPAIEITPEQLQEFAAKAATEIDPYYSSQLKLATDSFLRNAGYSEEQLLQNESNLERQYGTATRRLGEEFAERGFALSGARQREEQELAGAAQRDIAQGRRQLEFGAGEAAGQFAQRYGGLLGQPLPAQRTLPEAPTAYPGEQAFGRQDRQLPYYELSPSIYDELTGSEEFQRRGQQRQRVSELEGAERTLQGLGQQRSLIF